jgi:HSP20 family protein
MGSRDWNGFGGSLGDWDPWPSLRSASGEIQIPALDVVETDDAYKVTMELPGVAEDDIDVSWSNGLLSVRGEKRQDSEEKSEDRHVTERRYGSFKRPVRLPEGVEEDGLSATFKKGVLHIDVPKSTESKKGRRKIEVKTD